MSRLHDPDKVSQTFATFGTFALSQIFAKFCEIFARAASAGLGTETLPRVIYLLQ